MDKSGLRVRYRPIIMKDIMKDTDMKEVNKFFEEGRFRAGLFIPLEINLSHFVV